MAILVTGAAGFIGTNFVRYWREQHPDDHVVALDALTYAGVRENVDGLDGVTFVHADIGDTDTVDRRARGARRRSGGQLRRRVAQQPRRARPGSLLPHQRARDAGPVRGRQASRRAAVPPRVDVRGVRRPRPRHRREVHRGLAVPAADAVQRVEGRRRSRRAGLPRDVGPAGDDHQLRQQLRAVPVPGEGHPVLHDAGAGRRAAAAVRVHGEPSRVDPRPRPLQGDRHDPRPRARRRDVPRRDRRRAQHRADRRHDPRSPRQAGLAEDDRPRSSRPRPPLRPRLVEDPHRARLGAARSPGTPASPRRSTGMRRTGSGGSRCATGLRSPRAPPGR